MVSHRCLETAKLTMSEAERAPRVDVKSLAPSQTVETARHGLGGSLSQGKRLIISGSSHCKLGHISISFALSRFKWFCLLNTFRQVLGF